MTKAHLLASSGAAEQRRSLTAQPYLLSKTPCSFFVIMPARLQAQTHTLQQLLGRAGGAAAALLLLLAVCSLLVQPRQPPGSSPIRLQYGKQRVGAGSSRRAGPGAGALVGGTRLVPEHSIWRRPTVLLLGDSLTESALDDGGWALALAKAYRRKADVSNRGFSGFNTRAALLALPEIAESLCKQQVVLATVWLGANDAALPEGKDGRAHIPLKRYAENLESIVRQLQAAGVQQVVLMTPPPVWEGAPQARGPDETIPNRTYNTTATYAAAVRLAAAKRSLHLLDVWQLFESQPGWQQQLLGPDGLHLSSPAGQAAVFKGLMALINTQLPQLRPQAMPLHHPDWRQLYNTESGSLEERFQAEQAQYEADVGDGRCN